MDDLLTRVRLLLSQLEQNQPTLCEDSAAILVFQAFTGSQIEKRLCQRFQSTKADDESPHALENSLQRSRNLRPEIIQTQSPPDLPQSCSSGPGLDAPGSPSKKRKESPHIILSSNIKKSKSKSYDQAVANLNNELRGADLSSELKDCLDGWKNEPSNILLSHETNLRDAVTPYMLLEKFSQQADTNSVKWRFFVLLFYAFKVNICSTDLTSIDYEGTISANEAYLTNRRRDLLLSTLVESGIVIDKAILRERCQKWVKIGERYYEWQKRFGLGALIAFPTISQYWWELRANNDERSSLADLYDAKMPVNASAGWDEHAHVIWNFLTERFGLCNLTANFVTGGRCYSEIDPSPIEQQPSSKAPVLNEQVSGRQDRIRTTGVELERGEILETHNELGMPIQAPFHPLPAIDFGDSSFSNDINGIHNVCNRLPDFASTEDLSWINDLIQDSEQMARAQNTWESIYGSELNLETDGMVRI